MQWKSVAIKQQLRADLSAAADDSKLLLPVKINVPPSIDPIHRTSTYFLHRFLFVDFLQACGGWTDCRTVDGAAFWLGMLQNIVYVQIIGEIVN